MKDKKWASPLWSGFFLPKQRGRGRWSGRNRQKKGYTRLSLCCVFLCFSQQTKKDRGVHKRNL